MEGPLTSTPPATTSYSLCPSAATLYLLPSVYTFLFLTALPGNALSLWVFLRRIPTISPIHIYLSHLSASNLLLSLTAPFLAGYYARGSVWAPGDALCQTVLHGVTPVLHINLYISMLILTWVALSRFAALIRNTHAPRPSACATLLPRGFFTRLTRASFANTVCASMWLVSVGGVVPATVYYSVMEAAGAGPAGGCVEVCSSPAVELGGRQTATVAVPVITLFFLFYLLVLLSYVTVLRHLRRSRRNTTVSTSQSLLTKVFRNIVVILVVISVCLLPYHIFKPIFITLAHDEAGLPHSAAPDFCTCHPLSALIEIKNCLLLLATLRSSTDPVMYFLLDGTFRTHALRLLSCKQEPSRFQTTFWSLTGSFNPRSEEQREANVSTVDVDATHGNVS
ncbi:probable G-protein coupled receptor 82 [Cololabis saira]|uniref:probable G-protein coupled receptor 82 n=1 Tax=Cololabis saira TaxID=129043 RepID=UPI002AD43B42|nr:probable G-protein coupled receptor 82 [Cololabis saira]